MGTPSPLELPLSGLAKAPLRPLGIAALEAALPDGGLPLGAVVELCAPQGLAQATRIAIAAIVAAQRPSPQSETGRWCAWIDPAGTLHAPGLAAAGVDLARLLVVRPPRQDVARAAVRVTASRQLALVVVDRASLPGSVALERAQSRGDRTRWELVTRRLALAAEGTDTTVLLLSGTGASLPLPVALRIELAQPSHERLSLRITKDRRGRLSGPIAIPLEAVA